MQTKARKRRGRGQGTGLELLAKERSESAAGGGVRLGLGGWPDATIQKNSLERDLQIVSLRNIQKLMLQI